jgi:hypothetical protein
MLGDPQECRNHALLCREHASNATDPLVRKAYLSVANKWDQLADEIDQAKIVLLAINMVGAKTMSAPSASFAPDGQEEVKAPPP